MTSETPFQLPKLWFYDKHEFSKDKSILHFGGKGLLLYIEGWITILKCYEDFLNWIQWILQSYGFSLNL